MWVEMKVRGLALDPVSNMPIEPANAEFAPAKFRRMTFPKNISTRTSHAGGCKMRPRRVLYFTPASSYRYSTYDRTAPSMP